MAVRKLASGRWAVELQQHGRRVFRRLPALATRADALAFEAKIRRDLFAVERLGVKPEVPLEAAIQLWLEHVAAHQKDAHRARLRSKAWADWVSGKALRDAPEIAKEATAYWIKTPSVRRRPRDGRGAGNGAARNERASLSASTINRRLALLKAVLKWAWQQGMVDENLSGRVRMLPESGRREVYLTRGQVTRLASSAPSKNCRIAIWLLAYSGLRVSELLAVTATPSASGTLHVRESKTGRPRVVPVPRGARTALAQWLALSERPSYWQLHTDFCTARSKAKLPHVRIHDLRHTCASWLINAGVDLYTVGRILGHSSPLTTARYAHLAQGTLKRAMGRLR